eukprot:g42587.t1
MHNVEMHQERSQKHKFKSNELIAYSKGWHKTYFCIIMQRAMKYSLMCTETHKISHMHIQQYVHNKILTYIHTQHSSARPVAVASMAGLREPLLGGERDFPGLHAGRSLISPIRAAVGLVGLLMVAGWKSLSSSMHHSTMPSSVHASVPSTIYARQHPPIPHLHQPAASTASKSSKVLRMAMDEDTTPDDEIEILPEDYDWAAQAEADAKAYLPDIGLDKVLVKPGPPGPIALLPPIGKEEEGAYNTYIFLAGFELPYQLVHGSEEHGWLLGAQEAWLYGGLLDHTPNSDPEKIPLYHTYVTGQKEDIVKGNLISYPPPAFQERLATADQVYGFDRAHPDSGVIQRGNAYVTVKDGESVQAYFYYSLSPIAPATAAPAISSSTLPRTAPPPPVKKTAPPAMKFRPCIDIKDGKVTQIVGGSLVGEEGQEGEAQVNFLSKRDSTYYANLYKEKELTGGHVIMLGQSDASKEAALAALQAYPGGLQVGGGINAENAMQYIDAGASHVIVTSWVFKGGKLDYDRLQQLVDTVGKDKIVLDLSCRKKVDEDGGNFKYFVVTDRWQKWTDLEVNQETLEKLSKYCDEFLVHGVDVEGKRQGIEEGLVDILGKFSTLPVCYAGGVRSLQDMERIRELGHDRVDATVGSALSIFGGSLPFLEVVDWTRKNHA